MPSICMFFGIKIYMYPKDHLPPHFHAIYGEYDASFDFDGEVAEGSMPPRQCKLIAAWAVMHSEELAANWELAQKHKDLIDIDPLR